MYNIYSMCTDLTYIDNYRILSYIICIICNHHVYMSIKKTLHTHRHVFVRLGLLLCLYGIWCGQSTGEARYLEVWTPYIIVLRHLEVRQIGRLLGRLLGGLGTFKVGNRVRSPWEASNDPVIWKSDNVFLRDGNTFKNKNCQIFAWNSAWFGFDDFCWNLLGPGAWDAVESFRRVSTSCCVSFQSAGDWGWWLKPTPKSKTSQTNPTNHPPEASQQPQGEKRRNTDSRKKVKDCFGVPKPAHVRSLLCHTWFSVICLQKDSDCWRSLKVCGRF